MPPKRKFYKQWQRDSSIPIPKRTLVRLKKKAGGILDINVNTAPAAERRYASDSNHSDDDVNEIVENNFILEPNRTSDDECAEFPANDELNYGICDDEISIGEHADLDADEYSDRELICESESSSSDTSEGEEEFHDQFNDVIYPGASITVEESILSIMKYAIRHKMAYSELSDLLGLLSLHLPDNSNKEHLRSLYFLKKAFSSQARKDDLINLNEYCPDCYAPLPLEDDAEANCEFCGRTRSKREKNYFLTLDIGEQIKSMYEGKHSESARTLNNQIVQKS